MGSHATSKGQADRVSVATFIISCFHRCIGRIEEESKMIDKETEPVIQREDSPVCIVTLQISYFLNFLLNFSGKVE